MTTAVSVESRAQNQASCSRKLTQGWRLSRLKTRKLFLLVLKRSGFPCKIHDKQGGHEHVAI